MERLFQINAGIKYKVKIIVPVILRTILQISLANINNKSGKYLWQMWQISLANVVNFTGKSGKYLITQTPVTNCKGNLKIAAQCKPSRGRIQRDE